MEIAEIFLQKISAYFMPSKFAERIFKVEALPLPVAVFYNLFPARVLQKVYRHIADTLQLENKGSLVDIGAGPGFLAKFIAEKYPNLRVIGIDLSETMLKIAGKKKKGLPNLDFGLMDAKELKFPENSIDYIVSTLAFHHLKDKIKALNEMHRVLKTGGTAWIYEGYGEATDDDISKSFQFHLLKIQKAVIRKVFSWHGFSKKEVENEIKPLVMESNFKTAIFSIDRIFLKIELKK